VLRRGQARGEAEFAEKRREERMRSALRGFVRWVWAELDAFADVARRLPR
jgi:hypothetical protein